MSAKLPVIRLRADERSYWIGLLCLLLAAPYHLFDGYVGPAGNGRSAFAAAGVLVGCAAHRLCRVSRPVGSIRTSNKLSKISLFATLAATALEYLALPCYAAGDVEGAVVGTVIAPLGVLGFDYVLHVERFVAAGATALATLGFLSVCGRSGDGQLRGVHVEGSAPNPRLQRTLQTAPLPRSCSLPRQETCSLEWMTLVWLPLISLLAGFVLRAPWSLCVVPDPTRPLQIGVALLLFAALLLSAAVTCAFLWLFRELDDALPHFSRNDDFAGELLGELMLFLWASGMLIWTLLRRMGVGVRVSDEMQGAVILLGTTCVLAMLVGLALRLSKGREHYNSNTQDAEQVVGELRERWFLDRGLSPREAAYAGAVCAGKDMAAIADRYGIKPGTVRTTLHRAYRKLEVSNGAEMRALVSDMLVAEGVSTEPSSVGMPAESPSSLCAVDNADDNGRIHRFVPYFISLGRVCLMVLVLVVVFPSGGRYGVWGHGVELLLGFAAAHVAIPLRIAVLSATRLISDCDGAAPLLSTCQDTRRNPYAAGALRALVILVAGAICIVNREHVTTLMLARPPAVGPVTAVASFTLTYQLLQAALHQGESNLKRVCVELLFALLFSAFLQVIAGSKGLLWLVLAVGCAGCLAAGYGDALKRAASHRKADRCEVRRTASRSIVAGWFVGAVLGLVTEELWRSWGTESFSLALLPLPLAFGVAFWVGRRKATRGGTIRRSKMSLALFLMPFLFALIFGPLERGVAAAAWFTSHMIVAMAIDGGTLDVRDAYRILLAEGLSAIASVYMVNALQDGLLQPSIAIELLLNGTQGLSAVVSVFMVVFCPIAGWCLHVLLQERETQRIIAASSCESDIPQRCERERGMLVSLGLNSMQIEILLATARGKSTAEIAACVNYAPSTVKALRSSAYRQISCRGRKDLIALLSQIDRL